MCKKKKKKVSSYKQYNVTFVTVCHQVFIKLKLNKVQGVWLTMTLYNSYLSINIKLLWLKLTVYHSMLLILLWPITLWAHPPTVQDPGYKTWHRSAMVHQGTVVASVFACRCLTSTAQHTSRCQYLSSNQHCTTHITTQCVSICHFVTNTVHCLTNTAQHTSPLNVSVFAWCQLPVSKPSVNNWITAMNSIWFPLCNIK